MNAEQKLAIRELIVQYIDMIAELKCLRSILESAVILRLVPDDWEKDLERLKTTPQYQNVQQKFSGMLEQFDRVLAEDQTIALLQKISETKLPN